MKSDNDIFIENTINAILKVTNVDRDKMLSPCKIRECVDARRMLIAILYSHGFTQKFISKIVYFKNRSTINHLLCTHNDALCASKKYEMDFKQVKKIIGE